MTNTEQLKKAINDSGLKINFIAKYVGISRTSLWKKINNGAAFNQYEIDKLCAVLDINDLEAKETIFFAKM